MRRQPGRGLRGDARVSEVLPGARRCSPTPLREERSGTSYDCTDYAVNLFNLPTVAYSGEIDKQKQAADIMAEAHGRSRDLALTHIIGPETAHKIHPASKIDIEARLDSIAERARSASEFVHFETYTLRYNRAYWVRIDRMEEHWQRAAVPASYSPIGIVDFVSVENVSALTVSFPAGTCPLIRNQRPIIQVAGQKLDAPLVGSDRSWQVQIIKEGKKWRLGAPAEGLAKRHGLQGPIDDAFMDPFLFVAPGGGDGEGAFATWEGAERARAITHWRQQFRGDARVRVDKDLSDADIAGHNLVLWGDPSSNAIIAKIAENLPIEWDASGIRVGDKSYDAKTHALIMIYPNPLNPERYVVLNSGFTYREYDYLNNARQIPKLPDWAIIDLSEPPGRQRPGRVADAGFFDEAWQLPLGDRVVAEGLATGIGVGHRFLERCSGEGDVAHLPPFRGAVFTVEVELGAGRLQHRRPVRWGGRISP